MSKEKLKVLVVTSGIGTMQYLIPILRSIPDIIIVTCNYKEFITNSVVYPDGIDLVLITNFVGGYNIEDAKICTSTVEITNSGIPGFMAFKMRRSYNKYKNPNPSCVDVPAYLNSLITKRDPEYLASIDDHTTYIISKSFKNTLITRELSNGKNCVVWAAGGVSVPNGIINVSGHNRINVAAASSTIITDTEDMAVLGIALGKTVMCTDPMVDVPGVLPYVDMSYTTPPNALGEISDFVNEEYLVLTGNSEKDMPGLQQALNTIGKGLPVHIEPDTIPANKAIFKFNNINGTIPVGVVFVDSNFNLSSRLASLFSIDTTYNLHASQISETLDDYSSLFSFGVIEEPVSRLFAQYEWLNISAGNSSFRPGTITEMCFYITDRQKHLHRQISGLRSQRDYFVDSDGDCMVTELVPDVCLNKWWNIAKSKIAGNKELNFIMTPPEDYSKKYSDSDIALVKETLKEEIALYNEAIARINKICDQK